MTWIRRLWRSFWRLVRRRPAPLRTIRAAQPPLAPEPGAAYLVGEGGYDWYVALLCPCGCGKMLYMSLVPEGDPHWVLTEHGDGSISLRPSVWRTCGCRSHFFLRRGLIEWCR